MGGGILRVSVLMAVYNGEKYLLEALSSILAQTHTELEFVIVDDGSTDNTPAMLQGIQDARVKIMRQENQGLPAALNRGLVECTCDIVVRMDADDVAYPHRVEALLSEWERHGKPDVFGSGADYINMKGEYLWTRAVPENPEEIRRQLVSGIGMPVIHPSVLFRKSAIVEAGGYDTSFRSGAEDFELWLRLSDHCRLGNTCRPLLKYRLTNQQVTARTKDGGGSWWKLLALQKKYMIDTGLQGIWINERERVESLLRERFVEGNYGEWAALRRALTELKVKYRSGQRVSALWGALKLCFRQPIGLLSELADAKRNHGNLKAIILREDSLRRHGLLTS